MLRIPSLDQFRRFSGTIGTALADPKMVYEFQGSFSLKFGWCRIPPRIFVDA